MIILILIETVVMLALIVGAICLWASDWVSNRISDQAQSIATIVSILLIICISAVGFTMTPKLFKNSLVGSDQMIAEDVAIKTGIFNDVRVVCLYQEKDTNKYYFPKNNLFKFWKIYDKEYLSDEYAESLIKTHQLEQQYLESKQ